MDVEDLSALDPLGSGTFDDESHDFSQQLEMEERDRELAEPADPGLPSQRGDFSAPPTPEPLAEGIPPPSQQPAQPTPKTKQHAFGHVSKSTAKAPGTALRRKEANTRPVHC
jgi:hypothetical protein